MSMVMALACAVLGVILFAWIKCVDDDHRFQVMRLAQARLALLMLARELDGGQQTGRHQSAVTSAFRVGEQESR